MDSLILAQLPAPIQFLVFQISKGFFKTLSEELYFLGKLISIRGSVIYLKGQKEGLEIEYHESGMKDSVSNWKNGKMEGLQIMYDDSGVKRAETFWKNDQEDGIRTAYYPSGIKKYELHMKNNEETLEIGYDETGEKRYEIAWDYGVIRSINYGLDYLQSINFKRL